MSEKRFTLDKLEKGNAILSVRITDNVSNDNYFIMTKEAYEDDIDEIVDKLNEQQAILIKQEQKIKHLREVLTEIYVMSVQESIISEERSENDE